MSKKLAILVSDECKANVGKYNFVKDKEVRVRHHNVCKELQAFADESGFPIGVLVYIGVGTDAHKSSAFEKGYKKFNLAKAKRVVKMCKIFAERMGGNEKMAHCDKLVHAVCRFDDLFADQGKIGFFRERVNMLPKPNKGEKFKMTRFATAKEVARAIFGDSVGYNKCGYIIPLEDA